MAYDANIYGAFSGRPAYRLHLYVRHNAYSGNSQQLAWQLLAEQTSSGTTWAGDPQPWSVVIGGQPFYGSTPLDFRSTNSISMGSGVTNYFAHDSNGYLNVAIQATIDASGELFGVAHASGTFATNRIPQPPTAPAMVEATPKEAGKILVRFSGSGVDYRGSTGTGWQLQVATNSGFTTGVETLASSGTTTYQGVPGETYWFRSRATSTAGNGAWSSSLSAEARGGGKYGSGGTYKELQAYYGTGGTYKTVQPYYATGGVWKTLG